MNEHPTVSATRLNAPYLQNLEQLGDEEFWDYARQLAQQASPSAQSEEYLECILTRGTFLIPLTALHEVVLPPHHLTLLPATPLWMPGLVAWRGDAIAVIDLSFFLSGHTLDLSHGILLIANHAGLPIGLLVPSIGRTIPIQQEQQENPVSGNDTNATETAVQAFIQDSPAQAAYIKGRQQEAIILDVPLLLTHIVRHIEITASHG